MTLDLPEVLQQELVFYCKIEAGEFSPEPVIVSLDKGERSVVVESDGEIYVRDRETRKEIPISLIGKSPRDAADRLLEKIMSELPQEIDRHNPEKF